MMPRGEGQRGIHLADVPVVHHNALYRLDSRGAQLGSIGLAQRTLELAVLPEAAAADF